MAVEKCACEGDFLERFLQPVVLAILSKKSCTGYGVLKKIPEYVTFESAGPDPAGFYRYLKIMTERGLIEKNVDGDAERYSLTDEGASCLARWGDTLAEYAVRVGKLAAEISGNEVNA